MSHVQPQRRNLLLVVGISILAGFGAACGSSSDGPAVDTSLDAFVEPEVGEADTEQADLGGTLCTPAGTLCYSQMQVATCNDFGTAYASIDDCPDGTICMETSGVCQFPFCFPRSLECVDYWHLRECDESGSFWQDQVKCDEEKFCEEGVCNSCVPNSKKCVDESQERQCSADGSKWLDATPCAPEETCQDGGCFVCPASTSECFDDKTVRVCNDLGTSWSEFITCTDEELCIEGACTACGLNKTCLMVNMVLEECTAEGIDWSQQTLCEEDYFCAQGECLYKACFADVLLLVDRSGSMSGDWSNVKNSVTSIIEATDFARFALLSFPGDGNCGINETLDVQWTLGDAQPFTTWFEDFGPTGSTPLVAALEQVFTLAPLFFTEAGGTLVVLSDGQDTCANGNEEEDLMNFAAALFVNYDVTSYVIGYNFGGSTSQLNAIAANGGSEIKEYIPAGNEAELTEAFDSIVKDLKLCD